MIMAGLLKKVLFYLLLIVIWEVIFELGVEVFRFWKPYSFPSPLGVIKTLVGLVADNTLGIAVLASLRRIGIGYSVSLGIGALIGIFIAKFRFIGDNLSSLILGLQTLPSICWLPFAILWYGLDESAIIFVIAIGSTFAFAISIESGIRNVNPLYVNAARNMGASGLKIYWNVIIPAALPNIISGMKQGWSFAWRALMAGEMLTATVGLGQVLMVGRDLADISQVMAVMMVIIILGLLVDRLIFGKIEESIRYRWGLSRV